MRVGVEDEVQVVAFLGGWLVARSRLRRATTLPARAMQRDTRIPLEASWVVIMQNLHFSTKVIRSLIFSSRGASSRFAALYGSSVSGVGFASALIVTMIECIQVAVIVFNFEVKEVKWVRPKQYLEVIRS